MIVVQETDQLGWKKETQVVIKMVYVVTLYSVSYFSF